MNEYVKQVRILRALCQLMVEQQGSVLQLISDKLDELETEILSLGSSGKEVNESTASNKTEGVVCDK